MNTQAIADTNILGRFRSLYLYLSEQRKEKLGLVWGEPGQGKTTSAEYLSEEYGIVYCSSLPNWTPTQLANYLLDKATGQRRRSLTGAMSELINHCRVTKTAIILDEAERLINRNNLLETVRTIHDHAGVPVILVGMTGIYSSLQRKTLFIDRCMGFMEAPRPTFEDARNLADTRTIRLTDNFIWGLLHHKDVGFNLRRLSNIYSHIEHEAILLGLEEIDLKDWGDQPFLPEFARPPIANKVVAFGGVA